MSLPKQLSKEEQEVIRRWFNNGMKRFRTRIGRQTKTYKSSVRGRSKDLTIRMSEVIDFMDKGVSGHGRGDWNPYKNKSVYRGSKYRYKSQPPRSAFEKYSSDKDVQFLIARSIGRFGIPRKKFLDKYIDESFFEGRSYAKFLDELANANLNGVYKIFKQLER